METRPIAHTRVRSERHFNGGTDYRFCLWTTVTAGLCWRRLESRVRPRGAQWL